MKQHIKSSRQPRRTLNPEQLRDLKSKSKCRKCTKYGHWEVDHNADGSLKPGVLSTHEPVSSSKPTSSSKPASSSRSVSFNMVNLIGSTCDISEVAGPLLDDGAPYSGMGSNEFKILQPIIFPKWTGKLDPLPSSIADRPFWQYGIGEHSSDVRRIIGSVMVSATSDQGNPVSI